jgi:hypothetical protein
MGLTNVVYVVDYDIPSTGNQARRIAFYRAVHRLLKEHYGKEVKLSSQSCYFTEDKELAEKFLELVSGYSNRCNLYRAVKVR